MKKIKAYSNIWKIEKVFYAIEDFQLPRPITATQATWFVVVFLVCLVFKNYPPISFVDNFLIRQFAIPFICTIFLSKKEYDGKKPHKYLISMIRYFVTPRNTCRNQSKKNNSVNYADTDITVVKEVSK